MENKKYNILAYIGIGTFVLIGIIVAVGYIQGDGTIIGEQINSTKIIGDKEKIYDAVTKTVTLSNIKEGEEKEKIAEVQLKSEQHVQVGLGYQKVFEYTIDSYVDYNNFIQELEIYNLKAGNVKENKKIDLKYLTYETIDVPIYETTCKELEEVIKGGNSTDCTTTQTGTEKQQQERWIDIEKMDVKTEKITISGWTEVSQGDYYEWIPNFAGVKVNEWATWSGNISVGLRAYYKFDETSGTNMQDFVGTQNGTISGSLTLGSTGIIGTAYTFSGGTVTLTGLTSTSGTYAFNFWLKPNNVITEQFLFDTQTGRTIIEIGGTADGQHIKIPAVADGSFHMYTAILNSSDSKAYLYKDGIVTGSQSYTTHNIGGITRISGAQDNSAFASYGGVMDEVGIWNRTLSATEVALLYNNGTGCQYNNETCYGLISSTNCNFTGYVKDEAGTGLNNAKVIIINQTDNKAYYNTSTSATGYWNVNVSNNNLTGRNDLFSVVSYYNSTLAGGIKHNINSTCP